MFGPEWISSIVLVSADWLRMSLWVYVISLVCADRCRKSLQSLHGLCLWMNVVLDSGLDALVIVTAQTFGRTQFCFNSVLVWLSMNPPAVYLVKYIWHNSCLPELSITEVWYIPPNYGQVYKKTPKLSKVREQDQCMCSQCGNAPDLAFESIWNQWQHL